MSHRTPRSHPHADAALPVVERLTRTVAAETEDIVAGRPAPYALYGQRKNQGLLELNRLLPVFAKARRRRAALALRSRRSMRRLQPTSGRLACSSRPRSPSPTSSLAPSARGSRTAPIPHGLGGAARNDPLAPCRRRRARCLARRVESGRVRPSSSASIEPRPQSSERTEVAQRPTKSTCPASRMVRSRATPS